MLLDSFLLEDAKGDARFSTEGRGVVFCKLSRGEKIKLLKRLPKGAKYIKECFHAHWGLKVEQDPTQEHNIVAEPLWHNARFKLENVGKKEEAWLAKSPKLRKIQDIVDPGTRRLRTRAEWRRYIRDCEIKAPWSGHHAAHVSREVRGHASTHFIRVIISSTHCRNTGKGYVHGEADTNECASRGWTNTDTSEKRTQR